MKLFLLFLILMTTAVSLNTYTQNYYPNPDQTYYRSRVSLGNLNSGDVITFEIKFPRITGTSPTQYRITIIDSTSANLSPQPSGFNTVTNLGNTSLTWTVGTTGAYFIDVSHSGSFQAVVPYYLTVTNSNGGQIIKYSHVLTTDTLNVIHLASTSDITFSTTGGAINFVLYKLTSYEVFTQSAFVGAVQTTFTNVAPGYYYFFKTTSTPETITFQSDPYPCPYDPAYPDIFKTFEPCLDYGALSSSSSSDSSGSKMETWKIAVIAVFSVVGVAIIIIVIVIMVKKISAKASTATTAGATSKVIPV